MFDHWLLWELMLQTKNIGWCLYKPYKPFIYSKCVSWETTQTLWVRLCVCFSLFRLVVFHPKHEGASPENTATRRRRHQFSCNSMLLMNFPTCWRGGFLFHTSIPQSHNTATCFHQSKNHEVWIYTNHDKITRKRFWADQRMEMYGFIVRDFPYNSASFGLVI